MKKQNKTKKKIGALDIYVTFSIISLITYTIISQIIAMKNGIMLDTLTTCFFGFFGGEIVTCGLIKIFKLHDDKKNGVGIDDYVNTNTHTNANEGMAVG